MYTRVRIFRALILNYLLLLFMANYYFLEIKLFNCANIVEAKIIPRMYRTSGVIFFIDYCTAMRDTRKG
jgi:hypothetical protein